MMAPMRFEIPADTLRLLRSWQAKRRAERRGPESDIEAMGEAFLLDPGFGPMTYLMADGRVMMDHFGYDDERGIEEATENDAIIGLVGGARKTGIAELLDLIPRAPSVGFPCPDCDGSRQDTLAATAGMNVICATCSGRGWATEAIVAARRVQIEEIEKGLQSQRTPADTKDQTDPTT